MRQTRSSRIPRILVALLLICSFSIFSSLPVIAQTCTVQASAASPDSVFDRDFTQNGPGQRGPNGLVMEPPDIPGWTGGDSTYSVYLPMTGETVFFFSDSYIGQAPPAVGDGTASTNSNALRTRAVNCDPSFGCYPATNLYHAHNSLVVRDAFGLVLRTISGPVSGGYSTSYFVPADAASTGHFYWVGDSVLVNHVPGSFGPKVLTFLMEWDGFLNYYGAAIAQLSVPSLTIDAIQPIVNDPSGDPVHWGVSTLVRESVGGLTLYTYGIEDYLPYPPFSFYRFRVPHVSRVNLHLGLSGIADMNNWQVYNRTSGWVSDNILASSRIIGDPSDPNNANDSIGEGFTVSKIHSSVGTTYLLVSQDTNPNTTVAVDNLPSPPDGPGPVFVSTANEIILYSACSPEGPYSAKQGVYASPETQATTVPGMTGGQTLYGHLWTYNPVAHPQFNWQAGLLVSYNVNSDDSGDLIYADAYRPKFIRVPISGLLPDF
jgi:hypothetical protein